MAKLSTVIVSFNTAELLSACLESLLTNYRRQIEKGIFEVIVVDNGSSDATVTRIKQSFSWVKLIQNHENVGFAKANNQGIRKGHGMYTLLLNPDTLVYSKTLTRMISYLDKNPHVGIATCKVLLPNGMIDDASHRGFPTPWRALTHFLGLGQLFPSTLLFNGYHLGYRNVHKIHEIDAGVGAFLMIRKSVGEEVGWLDEDYFWYGEDLDLCFRVKEAGFKVMYVPDVAILHYKGASSGLKNHSQFLSKANEDVRQKATRARFEVMRIFYRKHYQDLYPAWLTQLVLMGIQLKHKLAKWWL